MMANGRVGLWVELAKSRLWEKTKKIPCCTNIHKVCEERHIPLFQIWTRRVSVLDSAWTWLRLIILSL